MQVTRTVIADPGHAWIKVPLFELDDLGILNRISEYSYVSGEWAYLEEDCDMGIYMDAMRAEGIEVGFFETYVEETGIRDMINVVSYRNYR